MSVIVTGMESSGTRAMRNLVAQMTDEEVTHISWPNGGYEWEPGFVEGSKVIIVIRRPDIRNISAVAHGHVANVREADEQWYRGIYTMAGIPGALWISYEAMVGNAEVQIGNIAKFLGVEAPKEHFEWIDANSKYGRID